MTKTLISLNQLEKSDVGNKTIVTNGFGVPVYVDYNSPFLPFLPLSGGTVSGATNFTNGLTANTISTTTFSSNTETIIGSVPTSATGSVSTGQSPRSVYTQGKYAYVVNDASKTLQIIDVSNPSSPVSVGSVSAGSGPYSVYVQGRYAYVVNFSSNTLQIIDVSNPTSPVPVGSASTGSGPYEVYVQGRYVYVVNLISSTLQVFDVSNPSSPVSVGSVSTGTAPISIYVQGRYAYVVNTNSSTLQIIDVSNPSSPVSVGLVSTGSSPYGVYVQGRYGYVVNFISNTLQIFDVSGSYIQQLEVGGVLTNTLESVGNATIGNDLTVVGGLSVSQSTNIQGNLSATNVRVVSGLTSNTISATTYQNLPTDVRVTGATYNNNTFTYTNNTGGTFNILFNTVTGLTVNGNLSVTGNTNVRALTGTSAFLSGSAQNVLTVVGSGTTSPIFTVQGSSGELFSINDSLIGSLFSVNNISGLPILEVFDDDTILMGSYVSPSLNTTKRLTLSAGTNTVYSIPTSAYTGMFVDYTLTSSVGVRAGNVMSIWSGSTAEYTDVSTNDIGTTTGVTFSVAISGNTAVITSSATTSNWTLKTIIRGI
jgi:hypothetical protein